MEAEWIVPMSGILETSRRTQSVSAASIYKAPFPLRAFTPEIYTPQMAVIGPLHRHLRQPQFLEISKYKQIASRVIVQDMEEERFVPLVEELAKDDAKVRSFFDDVLESEELDPSDLASMMALDAVFVVQLLHSYYNEHAHRMETDSAWPTTEFHQLQSRFLPTYVKSLSRPVRKAIIVDFILLENQIPLFLLKRAMKLDERCKSDEEAEEALEAFIAAVAYRVLPFTRSKESIDYGVTGLAKRGKHLLDCLYAIVTHIPEPNFSNEFDLEPVEVPSAAQLHKAGVKFHGHDGSLMDISFEKGTLSIPKIHVGDDTERIFRNLLAYESQMEEGVHVLSYLHFMNYLIDKPEDVDILVENGVMTETIGSSKHVASVWNKLCHNTVCVFSKRYSDVGEAARKHCDSRLHGLLAEFHRRYLAKPWLVVSLLSAIALLVMTFLTMWYTILIYHHGG